MSKDYSNNISELKKKIDNNSEDHELYRQLAYNYDKQERYSEALNYYKKSVEIYGIMNYQPDIFQNIGKCYIELKEYSKAYLFLGSILDYYRLNNLDEVTLSTLNDILYNIYYKNARELHLDNNYKDSRVFYEEATNFIKNNYDYLDVLGYLADCYIELKEYGAGVEYFKDFLGSSEKIAKLFYYQAISLYINNNYKEALYCIDNAISYSDDNKFPYFLFKSSIYFKQEKYEEAYNSFYKVMEDDEYFGDNYFEKEPRLFKKIRNTDKKNPVLVCNTGILYLKKDKKDLAAKCFKRAIEISVEEFPAFYYLLGFLYEKNDNLEDAIRYYEKAWNVAYDYGDSDSEFYEVKVIKLYHDLAEENEDNTDLFLKYAEKEIEYGVNDNIKETLKIYKDKLVEKEQNIMQAVSHTLGNMLYVQKGITENLFSSDKLKDDIKRLQLFQMMTSSILESIKMAFGGNINNNIEFLDNNNGNRISLTSMFYFSLALNLENLLFGGQEWEKKRKKLFSITSKNRKEVLAKIYKIKENPKFHVLELSDGNLLAFKDFFESKDFSFISKYFDIDVNALSSIFIEKDSYTFALTFVIFQELIKNMFKYGSINDSNVVFRIIGNNKENTEIIFENYFLNSRSKNKIGTLKGLKMIEMFANVLGEFKNDSNEKTFSIKIEMDKKYFNRSKNENIVDRE